MKRDVSAIVGNSLKFSSHFSFEWREKCHCLTTRSKLLSNETAEQVIKSDIFSRTREHCHPLKRLSYCLSLLNGALWLQRRINRRNDTHTLIRRSQDIKNTVLLFWRWISMHISEIFWCSRSWHSNRCSSIHVELNAVFHSCWELQWMTLQCTASDQVLFA